MNHFKQEHRFSKVGHKPYGKVANSILFHAEATDPDMLYFSRFQAFDPYLAFTVEGRRYAVITAGEYGRMVKESAFDEILLLNEVREQAGKRFNLPNGKQAKLHLDVTPFGRNPWHPELPYRLPVSSRPCPQTPGGGDDLGDCG